MKKHWWLLAFSQCFVKLIFIPTLWPHRQVVRCSSKKPFLNINSGSPSCRCLITGDPPLLSRFLQESLGITIKRKKKQDNKKFPLKVSTNPKWKVWQGLFMWWCEITTLQLHSYIKQILFWHLCVSGGRQNPLCAKDASSCPITDWEKWGDSQ